MKQIRKIRTAVAIEKIVRKAVEAVARGEVVGEIAVSASAVVVGTLVGKIGTGVVVGCCEVWPVVPVVAEIVSKAEETQ